jgi:phosphatidylglycerol:prolipoprotein diacylglycerol transferase
MLPILNIGPLAVPVPGLVLIIGVWLATSSIDRTASRFQVSSTVLNNLILLGLAGGILGARLAYVLRFLNIYLDSPLGIFSLNPATLSLPEGVLIGALISIVYANRKGMHFWKTVDALALGFAIFGIALGVSHLASGDAFGSPTTVAWGIELWGATRHPTQVYEILCALVIYLILRSLIHQIAPPGHRFLVWAGLSAFSRLILEGFRGDSVILFAGLRQAQLISLVALLGAMVALHLRSRNRIT